MPCPIIEATATYDVKTGRVIKNCDAVKIKGRWYYLMNVGNPSLLY